MILKLQTYIGNNDFGYSLMDAEGNCDDPLVIITLDMLKVVRIRMMRDLCNQNDFANISEWCHYPKWDALFFDGNALRPDCAQMHVSKDEFWYDCYAKHTTLRLSTERTNVSQLKAMGL